MFLLSDAPRVELILGASISPDSVYEGGDVYFDCRIQSRPPPKKIIWQFDVSQIPHPTDRPTVRPSVRLCMEKVHLNLHGKAAKFRNGTMQSAPFNAIPHWDP